MKSNRVLLVIAMLGAAVSISCTESRNDGGTTTGNPMIEMAMTNSMNTQISASWWRLPLIDLLGLSFTKALAVPPSGATMDSQGNAIILSQAYVVVKEVEFKESELAEGVESQEIQYAGPYIVDLFSQVPTSFGLTPAVAYPVRRIKMKFHRLEAIINDEPTELLDNSFLLIGSKNGLSFQVQIDEGFEYEVSGPNAITLGGGDQLLVALKIPALISQLDLSAVSEGTLVSSQNRVSVLNPCPALNASAQDLYTCFKDGLKKIGEAGVDSAKDGQLDSDDESVD